MSLITLALTLLFQDPAANAELGYQLTVPDGFVDYPEALSKSRDLVSCWVEETPASEHGSVVLCVQRMHGVLPRDAMKQSDLPANVQLASWRWRDFTLQGLRSAVEQNGEPAFALVAQVPLKKEAIQLSYAGPADQAERGDSLMTATLASLQGETNWLTDAQRSERLGKAAGAWVALGFAAIVGWRLRKRRSA